LQNRFRKVNYNLDDLAEPTAAEVQVVIPPGEEAFIVLNKVNEESKSKVNVGISYSLGVPVEDEGEILAKMREQQKKVKPDQLVFQGKRTEVFMHKLTLKESVWFMWENLTKLAPHAPVGQAAASRTTQPKHQHRDRANETTFWAKYTVDASNAELVDPDEPNGKSWTFSLPPGSNSRIMR